jgi:hypothetical protein
MTKQLYGVVLREGGFIGIHLLPLSYYYMRLRLIGLEALMGSLRDATISLYKAFNPTTHFGNLEKARDLWVIMFSCVAPERPVLVSLANAPFIQKVDSVTANSAG